MDDGVSHQVEQLRALLAGSRRITFFGGAGVSTESGIPDFRSASGLYEAQQQFGHSPEEILSAGMLNESPGLFFRYYTENLVHLDARPNAAHLALAELERAGKMAGVVTQNIDGLHQAAGSQKVAELHGSNWRPYCVDCGARYSLGYLMDKANWYDGVPRCSECGGMVRPDVVLYGEPLDGPVIAEALDWISNSDLLIVAGTSLAVYPAAGLVQHFRGRNIVLINKTETPLDAHVELVIHAPVGEVLGDAVASLRLPGD